MNARREQLSASSDVPKRGRLLLMVLFWALTFLVCMNVRVHLGRFDLPHMWTQVAFLGCLLVVYALLWTGEHWARKCGVVVFLFWVAVFGSGPYLAPILHFALAGLLLLLTLVLVFSKSVAEFLDSRRGTPARAFDASDIAPAINRLRQDYTTGIRVGSKDARLRRMLLAVARLTICDLAFFRRAKSVGTGRHEQGNQEG
jgi:hypothetical protein